jgi:hypothetical protein
MQHCPLNRKSCRDSVPDFCTRKAPFFQLPDFGAQFLNYAREYQAARDAEYRGANFD